jgi:hypothetical protein
MYLTRPSLSPPKPPDAVFAQRTVDVRSIALLGIETRPAYEDVPSPLCRGNDDTAARECGRPLGRPHPAFMEAIPARADETWTEQVAHARPSPS